MLSPFHEELAAQLEARHRADLLADEVHQQSVAVAEHEATEELHEGDRKAEDNPHYEEGCNVDAAEGALRLHEQ